MSSKYSFFRDTASDDDFSTRPDSTPDARAFDRPTAAGRGAGQERVRNVARIPLGDIVADEQVRETFDPAELRTLAHSIKTKGQIQPARVRWDNDRAKYVIIAGERRFRACELAGVDKLECVIQEGELDADEQHELQLIENLIRADLNPIEEAKAYRKLIEARGTNGKEVAAELGVPASQVQRSLRLLKLPGDVQDQVAAGVIPKSLFREVLKLKTEAEQRAVIDRYLDGGTYDTVAEAVQETKSGGKKKPAAKKVTKRFTAGGITLQASRKGRIKEEDLADTLRLWLDHLEAEGKVRLHDAA